jgi:hypothetical protein
VVGEKLTNVECLVTGCIVVVENSILRAPQIRLLLLNVPPQMPQNFSVKLCVDNLALEDKFAMSNAADVEKHDEHGIRRAVAHSCLLRLWR